jgi:methionyl-tRNA formyltransferase
MESKTYLVAGQHSWSKEAFKHNTSSSIDTWLYTSDKDYISLSTIDELSPDKIFFTHWSHIVPKEITDKYECICFHPSHLPYGRGGTPVQNLIREGFTETKLTAFRMTDEIDAGPIYLQYPLSLEGTAQQIYTRTTRISWDMIKTIIKYNLQSYEQEGTPHYFKRRTPNQSEISGKESLGELFDHIRMLSAENYPHAFIEYGDYIIEFCDPTKAVNSLLTYAIIYRKGAFDES